MPELKLQIRALREVRDLSQRNLAKRLGVSPAAVAQWETGRNVPTAKNLLALADALGCSVDALMGRAGPERSSA